MSAKKPNSKNLLSDTFTLFSGAVAMFTGHSYDMGTEPARYIVNKIKTPKSGS